MRERLVNRELNPLLTTLPDKFEEIHDYQVDAVSEIVERFESGDKLVVLEAPTGSGKTLIAECVRRLLRTRATYVCHNKELQAQFARDFTYSSVLYGRSNYEPAGYQGLDRVSCEDCTWTKETGTCGLCVERETCPYVVAKNRAIRSAVPVLNSAYWLSETLSERSRFANTGLCVLDEADTLDNVLMSQIEVYVSERSQKLYGIKPPPKLTKEYEGWIAPTLRSLEKVITRLSNDDSLDIRRARELRSVLGLHSSVSIMAQDLERQQPWVYTGGAGSERRRGDHLSFKPVKVDRFGASRIWSNDKRFLLMAAVVPDVTIVGLGWTDGYKRVSVDSQFHPKNRQVVVRPLATMTRKGMNDGELRALDGGVHDILERHAGDRILIHSVSYALRERMYANLRGSRPIFTFDNARNRARAIEGFKSTPSSILLAPGLERGVDLPDDLCRAQVILKVPFLSIGDKQVAERKWKTTDGEVWYQQHVATTIVQMVGRGVRSKDDYCTTYVLDKTFVSWYKSWGHLFPAWFRKAIRIEYVHNSRTP